MMSWNVQKAIPFPSMQGALLCALILSGCSNGNNGRFSYDKQEIIYKESKLGISAGEAISLLVDATNADKIGVIQKIATDHRPDFQWSRLWQEAETNLAVVHGMNEEARTQFLKLHRFNCSAPHFPSFARFLLRSPQTLPMAELNILLGKDRPCEQAMGPTLTRSVLARLRQDLNVEAAPNNSIHANAIYVYRAQAIADLVVREFNAPQPVVVPGQNMQDLWRDSLGALSGPEWSKVVGALIATDKANTLVDLLAIHDEVSPEARSTKRMHGAVARQLAEFPSLLSMTIRKIGFSETIQMVAGASPRAYGRREIDRPAKMKIVLNEFALEFARQSRSTDRVNRWNGLIIDLKSLRELQASFENYDNASDSLAWLEKIHRHVERDLERVPGPALSFLHDQESSFDLLWLKIRMTKKFLGNMESFEGTDELDALDPAEINLNKILAARMKVHLGENDLYTDSLVGAYCDLLSDNGVAPESITLAELRGNATNLLQTKRGCITVDTSGSTTPLQITQADKDFSMPFDSVWIAPGLSLGFKTQRFDGSIFQLSDQSEHNPIAEPLAPGSPDELTEYDPISIPLVMGYQSKTGEKRFHFFVYQYVIQEASLPPESTPSLLAGNEGGSITIDVEVMKESYLPQLVSLGGPGQSFISSTKSTLGLEWMIDPLDTEESVLSKIPAVPVLGMTKANSEFLDHNVPSFDLTNMMNNSENFTFLAALGNQIREPVVPPAVSSLTTETICNYMSGRVSGLTAENCLDTLAGLAKLQMERLLTAEDQRIELKRRFQPIFSLPGVEDIIPLSAAATILGESGQSGELYRLENGISIN